jgi:hypothetical protein
MRVGADRKAQPYTQNQTENHNRPKSFAESAKYRLKSILQPFRSILFGKLEKRVPLLFWLGHEKLKITVPRDVPDSSSSWEGGSPCGTVEGRVNVMEANAIS